MSGLLPVLMSWGSLLLRGAVIAQLLVVITPLIGAPALARRWLWLRRQGQQRSRQLALLVSGTGIGLLASFSQPVGLALLVLAFNLGWQLLHLLERRLRPWLDGRRQQQMFSRILRPTYLVICTLILIDQLTDLRSLALLPLGVLFAQEISLGELALAIALLYGLMVGAGPLGRSLSQLLQRAMGFDEGSRRATALLSRYLIVFLGLLLLLNRLGFNRNALLAVAGGLSIGVGFGIREVIANLISGVWLLFEGSVRPGEILYLDGSPCEVRSLGLRATVLWRDSDNAEIVIPNQTFFTSPATTYSAIQTGTERLRRSEVKVAAAYRHRPMDVVDLLESIAAAHERVLPHPPAKAFVLDYGESAVDYAVRFFIAHPMDHTIISSAVRMAIWEAFEREGIEMPFPQRVMHSSEPQQPRAFPPAAGEGAKPA
jgi:potassium-dependent mechanosensitive channel